MATSAKEKTKVFFHVGLERTGTTFLQRKVFPHFSGIGYVPKKRYHEAPDVINSGEHRFVLVSHEFNRGFSEAIQSFHDTVNAEIYPIIVLRRHDQWLLSLYKRDLKNGKIVTLRDYVSQHLNADALHFHEKIKRLKTLFHNPLILLYDELVSDPRKFIEKIAIFTGAAPEWNKINLTPYHTSYSDHQLKVLFQYSRIGLKKLIRFKIVRYFVLNLALVLPKKWFSKTELYTAEDLKMIRESRQQDWDVCLNQVDQSR